MSWSLCWRRYSEKWEFLRRNPVEDVVSDLTDNSSAGSLLALSAPEQEFVRRSDTDYIYRLHTDYIRPRLFDTHAMIILRKLCKDIDIHMKELLANAAIYATAILLLCPVVGAFINWIVLGLLRSIFRIFDKRGRSFVVFVNVITLLGVIHHELSHALFAFVTGAKIKNIDLYKVKAGSLGSVSYVPRGPLLFRSLQMSVSSAAPVFVGFITETLLMQKLLAGGMHPALLVFLIFLFVSILVHMDMSTQDIMVYIKGVPMCFLLLALIFVVLLVKGSLPNIVSVTF